MGYVLLVISVICGNIKGFCGKKTSNLTKQTSDAVLFNLIRMVLCALIGFVLILPSGIEALAADSRTILIAAFAGVANSLFVVGWLTSVKYGMYMTVEVAIMLGTIVPILLSVFAFDEPVAVKQVIGLLILIAAVYIMCSYNAQQKGKTSLKSYLVLLLCGLANGLADFSQKFYVATVANYNIKVYNFYIYVFSAIVLLLFCLVFKPERKVKEMKSAGVYLLIMAVCLFGYSYFKTGAAAILPAIQLYPLSQSLSLITSTLMAAFLFKEKITSKCVTGIVLSFVALLFINL